MIPTYQIPTYQDRLQELKNVIQFQGRSKSTGDHADVLLGFTSLFSEDIQGRIAWTDSKGLIQIEHVCGTRTLFKKTKTKTIKLKTVHTDDAFVIGQAQEGKIRENFLDEFAEYTFTLRNDGSNWVESTGDLLVSDHMGIPIASSSRVNKYLGRFRQKMTPKQKILVTEIDDLSMGSLKKCDGFHFKDPVIGYMRLTGWTDCLCAVMIGPHRGPLETGWFMRKTFSSFSSNNNQKSKNKRHWKNTTTTTTNTSSKKQKFTK